MAAASALRPTQCIGASRSLSRSERTARPTQRAVVPAQVEHKGSSQQAGGAAVLESGEARVPSPAVNVIQPVSR